MRTTWTNTVINQGEKKSIVSISRSKSETILKAILNQVPVRSCNLA